MEDRGIDRLDVRERLSRSVERQAGMAWPVALHRRLDELVAALDENGEPTTRKELVAALLLATPNDVRRLTKILRDYRKAKVRDALVAAPTDENVIELPRQGPGRRTARPGSA